MKGWDGSPRNIQGLAEDRKLENSRKEAGGDIKLPQAHSTLYKLGEGALPPSRHSLGRGMGLGKHNRLGFIFPSPLGWVPVL